MTESQESLLLSQEMTFSHIKSALMKFNALSTEECNQAQVQTRLSMLDANWSKFKSCHDKITRTRLTEEIRKNKYFTEDIYAACEETYVNAKSLMLTSLEEFRSITSTDNSIMNQSINNSSHLRSLPKITLPKFSGSYHDWRPFHDLFTSMIHSNSDLTAVEKFYYLKSSLSGEALQCISNLPVSSENFAPAWKILCTQYENTRMLINSHLDCIFELPRLQRKSSSELKNLLATVKESLGALEALGSPIAQWDHIIVYMVVRRLDASSHEAWELCRSSSKKPATFSELEIFLSGRIQALESVESRGGLTKVPKKSAAHTHVSTSAYQKRPVEVPNKLPLQTNNYSCSLCSSNHYISSCDIYNGKTLQQKHDVLSSKNLCYNCLGPHRVAQCKSSKSCRYCNGRHHSSIHGYRFQSESSSSENPTTSTNNPLPTAVSNHTTSAALNCTSNILLATALVRIKSSHGVFSNARALLDQGSEVTLISEELVKKLHLKRHKGNLNLIGVGALQSGATKGLVHFTLYPHFESSFQCTVSAYVLTKLTTQLPSCTVKLNNTTYLKNIQLADPNFMVTSKIDLIIGADLYGYLLEGEIIKGTINTPVAQLTSLGWILSGGVHNLESNAKSSHSVQVFQCRVDHNLDELLQRFWTQEEGKTKSSILSPEEKECEAHFQATYRRDSSGRYIVRLPFKSSPNTLGDSRKEAERMLAKLYQKSESNPQFFKLYSDFLKEYESLGHMVPSSQATIPTTEYFLPHHGVLRESSTTTKLRVVFNGSCKTSSGLSLNDILHTGPKLQLEISDVITRWRQYRYVFFSRY
ncbi:uncharacterized protein LOC124420590 [Lucilia cuprina]|uniref:uncharacterized protein LOC124420590 n=1 Tax=Lucilia cuprina TaxID=7375 RepID=UPI001F0547E7|nr:uncharacterized protein LOC124420590 [Lucilia cuprina]